MKLKLREWFQQVWPTEQKRMAVIGDYQAFGKLALTDIALRGRVYSDVHQPGDTEQTFINIGRRQLAIEILELAGEEPQRLFDLVERKPLSNGESRDV